MKLYFCKIRKIGKIQFTVNISGKLRDQGFGKALPRCHQDAIKVCPYVKYVKTKVTPWSRLGLASRRFPEISTVYKKRRDLQFNQYRKTLLMSLGKKREKLLKGP